MTVRVLRAMAVIHPLPSGLNAIVVATLALLAGAGVLGALALSLAMLGFQASIGSLNDLVDAERDRLSKPGKPIPAGLVPRPAAMVITLAGGALGLAISAAFGPIVLVLGAAGYGCGMAYDLAMRRLGWGWLCFALALPLLLLWTWTAAAGALPPGWPFLLPVAAVAGPMLHLSNSLVDLERDQAAAGTSLATQLGRERSGMLLVALVIVTHVLAWSGLAVLTSFPPLALLGALAATSAAIVGVRLSWQDDPREREHGWRLQAVGLALLAVVWVASAGGR